MQMVVEAHFPHSAEVPHPFEAKATVTIEVTLKTIIEAHTPHMHVKAPPIDHVELTPPENTYLRGVCTFWICL